MSTENNGGFIQMRMPLAAPPAEGSVELRVIVLGNVQRHFVHLRTGGTLLPRHYDPAGFDVTRGWTEVRLSCDAFATPGALLRAMPVGDSLTTVGSVAKGRE